MVVDSLMDAVAGARRTPGRLETGGVPSKPPATILLSVALGVLGLRFALPEALRRHLQRCCRGSRIFLPCRCGDSGFVSRHKPAEHHIAMFLHLQTLRRHVSRPVAAGVSLSAVHIFSFLAGEIAEEALPSGFSFLEAHFQGGTTTFVLQGQLPLIPHDTLHWPRASSFQLPWGRGVGSVLSR